MPGGVVREEGGGSGKGQGAVKNHGEREGKPEGDAEEMVGRDRSGLAEVGRWQVGRAGGPGGRRVYHVATVYSFMVSKGGAKGVYCSPLSIFSEDSSDTTLSEEFLYLLNRTLDSKALV